MAPDIVWDELPDRPPRLRVLDPMAGSGTTLVTARLRGHEVIGFDSDPLAVLIARSWLSHFDHDKLRTTARRVIERARHRARNRKLSEAYPRNADEETKSFIRFWFDRTNRIQLAALSLSISRLRDATSRDLMWCALSRLIITKASGVSLAMDISHSRPHRVYTKAPIRPFDYFQRSVEYVIKSVPPVNAQARGRSSVRVADARTVPLPDNSVDVIITSPPYLNAIDYLRGHKFTLVWMGYRIEALRALRASNVGTESGHGDPPADHDTLRLLNKMCPVDNLTRRQRSMLSRYVRDMRAIMSESHRVLRPGGKAVFVVGNSNLRDTFVENSKCVACLARDCGMTVRKPRIRPIPDNRRYLPPPRLAGSNSLRKRMREEVIITMIKPSH